MTTTPGSAATAAGRLLTELVCRREEAAGHPAPPSAADTDAIAHGGSFARRIANRARHLPGSDVALIEIQRVLAFGRSLALGWWLLAAVFGFGAAVAALNASPVVSLPLVLLTLVGINLLSLLVWLLLPLLGLRSGTTLATLWASLPVWWHRRLRSGDTSPATDPGTTLATVRLLTTGRPGRWRMGAMIHTAWLGYSLGGLLALALLLSTHAYALGWQTTLLSPDSLRRWAQILSFGPALLGAPGAESLALGTDPGSAASAADRAGWARWILLAVLSYGVFPRLAALLLCAGLLWRAEGQRAGDLTRPGFARLRDRLMPERGATRTIDAAIPAPVALPVAAMAPIALPAGCLHGLALEWDAAGVGQPASRWRWLGSVDDAASRSAVMDAVRGDAQAGCVVGLVIVLRAPATPDRGLARWLVQIVATAAAPAWMALGDLPALRARGALACAQRLAQWRLLAQEAGVRGGLLEWDAARGLALPLPEIEVLPEPRTAA